LLERLRDVRQIGRVEGHQRPSMITGQHQTCRWSAGLRPRGPSL